MRIITIFILTLLINFRSYSIEIHNEIEHYVDDLVDQVSKLLDNHDLSEEQKIEQSRQILFKNLDLDWMAKYTLGRYRKQLSPIQIKEFVVVYSSYVIKSYSDLVRNYKGEKANIKKVMQLDENEFVVKTEVIRGDGQQVIKVDYLVRDLIKGDKYNLKVSDIITEGVSMVNAHQDEFSSIIANNGFDALLIQLKKKI